MTVDKGSCRRGSHHNRFIVKADRGKQFLETIYGVASEKIEFSFAAAVLVGLNRYALSSGRTNEAMMVAIIRRAADVNAAIFNPEMIRSAVTPLTKAPNAATPIAPPTCRAEFSTADAVPDLARSTVDNIAVVMAGTASPIPAGMKMKPGSMSMNVDRPPNRSSRQYPTVAIRPPRIIGGREPVRAAIQPLAMFDAMKVPVRGRKASPAWTVE
jgi:hypothetical protein